MKKTSFLLSSLALVAVVFCPPAAAQNIAYPQTKKVDQVDTYFGVTVADPYRWLEEENAPETAKWVEEQNKVTFAYLETIPYRQAVKTRLEKLFRSGFGFTRAIDRVNYEHRQWFYVLMDVRSLEGTKILVTLLSPNRCPGQAS